MSAPFVAEIRLFPFYFAPTGWAWCNGQLLPISQNTALFSLLGTFYGGDGKSTFALPDLQGRAAMHQGQGQGLSERFLGEASGSETVTLLQSEMPAHTHSLQVDDTPASYNRPTGDRLLAASLGGMAYTPSPTTAQAAPTMLASAGGSLPHNNMQPYLTLNYAIALQGVFPARS